MDRKQLRQVLARRTVFIGCQFCGETDRTLRNYGSGKICPECLKRKGAMSNSDTGKEKQWSNLETPISMRRV